MVSPPSQFGDWCIDADISQSDVFFPTASSRLSTNSHQYVWNVFTKNGRINSETRLTTLLAELGSQTWDFVCFSETRCLIQDVILQGGHRLITNLAIAGSSGVGNFGTSQICRFFPQET